MTAKKIIDMYNKVMDFIDRMIEIQNMYINKINRYLEDIEDLVNNAINHSKHYIEMQINKLFAKIDKLLDGFRKKMNSIVKQIEDWYNDQMNQIKTQIILFASAKLGIYMTKTAAKAAAEAIPHPDLNMPNFEIELAMPSLEELLPLKDVKISLPRIPTL